MSQSDRAYKLFVRSVIAGTTTFSTLMGAQSLALLDKSTLDDAVAIEDVPIDMTLAPMQVDLSNVSTVENTPEQTQNATVGNTPELAQIVAVTPTILKVEPSITIFRQTGSSNTSLSNGSASPTINVQPAETAKTNNAMVIQPPQPVALAQPEPVVIIEEPVVPVQQVAQFQPQQQFQPQPQQQVQQSQPKAQQQNKSKKSKSGSSK